jgi:hypothetical protein
VSHGEGLGHSIIEAEHRVKSLRKWLPAGPTDSGGVRKHDIVQFVAVDGGIRTVEVRDLVDIR